MRLEHAERGQPERRQVALEVADVVIADAQVVQQVARARPVDGLDQRQLVGEMLLQARGLIAEEGQRGDQSLEEADVGFQGHAGNPVSVLSHQCNRAACRWRDGAMGPGPARAAPIPGAKRAAYLRPSVLRHDAADGPD